MDSAVEEALIVAGVDFLAKAVPAFGTWLAGVLGDNDQRVGLTLRVRDVLGEKSASRLAAEKIDHAA